MKRKIDPEALSNFISKFYQSRIDFSRKLAISYSHQHKLLNGKTLVGCKVYKRLEVECKSKGVDIEELLEPLPIVIAGEQYREIIVSKDGELIASITSTNCIAKSGFEVKIVPCEREGIKID